MAKVDAEIDNAFTPASAGDGCLVIVVFGAVMVALTISLAALAHVIGAAS